LLVIISEVLGLHLVCTA